MICNIAIRGRLIPILFVATAISAVAGPLEDLEAALVGQGVSSSQAAAIVSEADGPSWEQFSADTDFSAVARSLTVESSTRRRGPEDLADLAYRLTEEAATLQRLGFTRREVARTLSEGVRAASNAESLRSALPAHAASAATGLSRGRLRRDMQEIAGRRGPSRGAIPSGVAQRILNRPLPGGDGPITNGPDGPDEAPETPDTPGGR